MAVFGPPGGILNLLGAHRIKKNCKAKIDPRPNNLGLDLFLNTVGHLGELWWPLGFYWKWSIEKSESLKLGLGVNQFYGLKVETQIIPDSDTVSILRLRKIQSRSRSQH